MSSKNKKNISKEKDYKNLLKLRSQLKETTYKEFLKRPGGKFPPEG